MAAVRQMLAGVGHQADKSPLATEMAVNGFHYTRHGDYYFPDLELPKFP